MAAATEYVKRETSTAVIVLPQLLAEIFAAVEHAEIPYCLLRGYEELEGRGDLEIDVLVASGSISRFAEVLRAQGFVRLPAWGHAPHHFFLNYDRALGRWLKFDAVTVLRYGRPVRALQIDLAAECLRKRKRCGQVFVLAPEDEFFTLLLHGLLDKGHFRPERSTRLRALREQLRQSLAAYQTVEENFARYLRPALDWSAVVRACERNDLRVLLHKRKAALRQLVQRQRFAFWRRTIFALLLRHLRPLLFAGHQPGLAVALLAPDGAGKSTLAAALQKDFGLRAQLVYMGTNVAAGTVGLPTTKWLQRRLKPKSGKPRLPKFLRLLLKPVNYLNRVCEQWYRCAFVVYQKRRGRFVVCDRYVYDSWIANPTTAGLKRWRRAWLEWGWPTPDLVILLDAPGELLFARKGEHSVAWLEKQRAAYLALQPRLPQMRVVAATQTAEEVKREVIALIWKEYQSRYRL